MDDGYKLNHTRKSINARPPHAHINMYTSNCRCVVAALSAAALSTASRSLMAFTYRV